VRGTYLAAMCSSSARTYAILSRQASGRRARELTNYSAVHPSPINASVMATEIISVILVEFRDHGSDRTFARPVFING